MSASSAAAAEPAGDFVTLRGTASGLEIQIEAGADVAEVADQLARKLEESPGFFAGNDASLRFSAEPPAGVLAPIEAVTSRFGVRIVAVRCGDDAPPRRRATTAESAPPAEPVAEAALPPKMLVGPIRSGCVLEIAGHLIVFGDVNPSAEIRATGSIVVLGRLRGIAHAGPGSFILALELAPQQLRIGNLVARAGDSDDPGTRAEIAFAKDGRILVETYTGRLPFGIATAKL